TPAPETRGPEPSEARDDAVTTSKREKREPKTGGIALSAFQALGFGVAGVHAAAALARIHDVVPLVLTANASFETGLGGPEIEALGPDRPNNAGIWVARLGPGISAGAPWTRGLLGVSLEGGLAVQHEAVFPVDGPNTNAWAAYAAGSFTLQLPIDEP